MRKKSTRIISAALAAAMMLSVCPVSAFATYRQAEAEKAVAAYAAQDELDEENASYSSGSGTAASPRIIRLSNGKPYAPKNTIDNTTYDSGSWKWSNSAAYQNAGLATGGIDGLTINSGYFSFTSPLTIGFMVGSKATLVDGTFTGPVIIQGTVNGGLFATDRLWGSFYSSSSPEGTVKGGIFAVDPAKHNCKVSGTVRKLTATGCTISDDNSDASISDVAYTVGNQVVYVTYTGTTPKITRDADGKEITAEIGNNFLRFEMPTDSDVTVAVAATRANLELDENGYPTESKGGTLDVEEYSNWKYNAADKKLTLLEGTFDLETTEINYDVTVGNGTSDDAAVTLTNANISGMFNIGANGVVDGGTFNKRVSNDGVINNGTFNYYADNYGTINDGTFNGSGITNYGTVNGGTFQTIASKTTINGGIFEGMSQSLGADDAFQGRSKFNLGEKGYTQGYYKVNGMVPYFEFFSVIAAKDKAQTFTITSLEANTSWSFSNDTDTLTVEAGQQAISGFGGKVVASASADGKDLTLTVTDTASLGNLTMKTLTLPAAKAENYTIKMDGSELTADGGSLAYDANANRSITVTRKATDDAAAAELAADQFTTIITRDGEPVNSIGLPGEYKVTVSIHDGAASGELTGYTFTIEKAEVDEAAMKVLLENFSFYIGAEQRYPNKVIPSYSDSDAVLAAAGFGDYNLTGYQKLQEDSTWADIEGRATDPGTYAPVFTFDAGSLYQGFTLTYKDYCNSEKIQNKTFTVVAGRVYKDDFEPGKTIGETNPTYVDEDKLGGRHIVYYAQDGKTVVSTDTAPTELGTYKVGFRYDASKYYEAFDYGPVSGWTLEVKETPTADQFEVKVADNLVYTGEPIDVNVTINGSTEGITVKYQDEHGNITPEKPTNVGTYTVLIDYAGSDTYEAVKELEVCKFTINRADLSADDFTFDKSDNRVHSEKVKDAYIHVTYRRTDAEGPSLAFTDKLPNIAGTYEITYTVERTPNYNSMDETAVAETYTVNKLTAEEISEGDLFIFHPLSPVYSGKAEEVIADVKDPNKPLGTITVNYYNEAGEKLEGAPVDAGTYTFTITVGESYNNEEVTLTPKDNSFTIKPASEVVDGEVTVTAPDKADLYEDGTEKGVTPDFGSTGLTAEDVTITYTDAEGSQTEDAPTKAGKYTYTVTVKADKGNYAAGAKLAEGSYTIKPAKGDLDFSYGDITWTYKDNDEPLTVGATVTITAPDDTEVSEFHNWIITVDGVEQTDPEQLKALGITWDEEDPETDPLAQHILTFTMPAGKVNIAAYTTNPQQEAFEKAAGTALIVTGVTAATGAVYYFGTGAYLKSVLPAGVAIPQNYEQLAVALWEKAGEPATESTAVFTDVAEDNENLTAIRWAVESGLLSTKAAEDGTSFRPGRYVTRVETIVKLFKLQKQLDAAQSAE